MPHQCLKCQEVYSNDSDVILKGCIKCGSKVFMYMKNFPKKSEEEIEDNSFKISKEGKKAILRELEKREDFKSSDEPIILDLENIKVIDEGKYEIDINQLFKGDKPLVYKVDGGTYVLDLKFMRQKNVK